MKISFVCKFENSIYPVPICVVSPQLYASQRQVCRQQTAASDTPTRFRDVSRPLLQRNAVLAEDRCH